jgi:hypothetical protein
MNCPHYRLDSWRGYGCRDRACAEARRDAYRASTFVPTPDQNLDEV